MARKLKKAQKLNLIPILDAIFIFIFFLLMSAQFLDIYQIGSDAPITSTANPEMKKPPLNLTLVLQGDKITVKTGLDEVIYKTYKVDQLAQLNEGLIELKKLNPTEDSAIIKPTNSFKYEKIINVIDHTREILKKDIYITAIDSKNKKYPTRKLFEKIIFETQD
jgi:biopolymer transport protein ExbD